MVDIDPMGLFRSIGRPHEPLRAKSGDGLQKSPAMELHSVFRFYINRSGAGATACQPDKENTWQAKSGTDPQTGAPAPP